VGQWLDALDFDFCPDFPSLAEVVAVKSAQGADGLVEGGSGELAVGLEVDEEVENLAWFEIRERSVGEMIGELRGPAEVSCNGAAAQSFELDEAEVVLIPRSRRECVYLFFICVIRVTARVTSFNAESRSRRAAALFNKPCLLTGHKPFNFTSQSFQSLP
jgi:hypothetical protein